MYYNYSIIQYDDIKTIEKLKCQIATMEKNKAFNFNVNVTINYLFVQIE